jgi:hypothetical protein
MRVMFDITDPDQRKHTMTEKKGRAEVIDVKGLLADDDVFRFLEEGASLQAAAVVARPVSTTTLMMRRADLKAV